MSTGHQFLWLDLETTGLDPLKCRILEWAVVLAADDAAGDMSVIESYSGVIGFGCAIEGGNFDGLKAARAEMDDYVTKMHTRNGLIQECTDSTDTLADADQFLADLCENMGGEPGRDGGPGSVVLAGASVGQLDRPFILHHMPKFARFVSYRCFDVSTLKMANKSWAGVPFEKARAHRAMPDVLESLEHAKNIRQSIATWATP